VIAIKRRSAGISIDTKKKELIVHTRTLQRLSTARRSRAGRVHDFVDPEHARCPYAVYDIAANAVA